MKIWEPKPPGTLWATLGLLQDSFTFTLQVVVDVGTPLKPPVPPSFAMGLFWNTVLLELTQLEMCSKVIV